MVASWCHYDTVQYVRIKDRRIFLLYTTLVVSIAAWIAYTLIQPAGHQVRFERARNGT